MTQTNCNEFILPQGQSDGAGSTKETQSVARKGDESKVENKTVSEISRCWRVSGDPRHRVLQNILLHCKEMSSEWVPPTLEMNTLVSTVVLFFFSKQKFLIFNSDFA